MHALLLRSMGFALVAVVITGSRVGWSAELQKIGALTIEGTVFEAGQISGIAFSDDQKLLFLAADEEGDVQLFRRVGNTTRYQSVKLIKVLPDNEPDTTEADLEALALEGHWLYVMGSHSSKRHKVDPAKSRAKNREHLSDAPDKEKGRRLLVRIRVDSVENAQPVIERSSLWDRIQKEPLETFARVPSKENGVDIEGLAVADKRLLVGFRAPILRGGFAIVMDTKFGEGASVENLFLDLGGAGIRDMVHLGDDQFLVLCGPSGDVAGTYVLKMWNGMDGTPGSDGPAPGKLRDLGTVPPPMGFPDAKAEGVTIFRRTSDGVDVVVVYDGADRGMPTLFHVPLP